MTKQEKERKRAHRDDYYWNAGAASALHLLLEHEEMPDELREKITATYESVRKSRAYHMERM